MIDLYLKAEDEAALIAALPFARSNNVWVEATHDFALDIIGTLYTEVEHDEEGMPLTPPVKIDGFHANIRCTPQIQALIPEDIIINVGNPRRVWL